MQFMITVEVKRGVLMKALSGGGEFIVEGRPTLLSHKAEGEGEGEVGEASPSKFQITPDSQRQPLAGLMKTGEGAWACQLSFTVSGGHLSDVSIPRTHASPPQTVFVFLDSSPLCAP